MFLSILNDGGSVFMYPLVVLLILVLVMITKSFVKKDNNEKCVRLISSISLFAIVWGIFGQVLGLISAFDAIEATGNISPSLLASGLKVSFLPTAFGMFIFLLGRLGIIVITATKK